MIDFFDLGMIDQKRNDLLCVFHMAVEPQGQGFGSLKQQEGIKRGNGSTGIPEQDCTDIG